MNIQAPSESDRVGPDVKGSERLTKERSEKAILMTLLLSQTLDSKLEKSYFSSFGEAFRHN